MTAPAVGDLEAAGALPPPRQLAVPRWLVLCALLAAELALGLASTQLALMATAHALLVAAVAGYALLVRNLVLAVSVLAYLPGSEILWRQARAPSVPYQWGPYLAIGISLFALVFMVGRTSRSGRLALLYLGLLVPGSALTIAVAGGAAQGAISFALAGPAALGLGYALLSQLEVWPWLLRRLLWVALVGTVGPLGFAVGSIQEYLVNAGAIDFRAESNFVTAGGFGPVQVSSVLGLGALVALLLVLQETAPLPRIIAALTGIALAVQSLLTFSRGGMISVAIAATGVAIAVTRDRSNRSRVWLALGLVLALGWFVVIPRIDAYTAGAFNERFGDTRTTRTDLASNDIEIFLRNPLFGVGPGMTRYQRLSYEICELRNDSCEAESSSHTEYTRSLSEHGIVGGAALLLLLGAAVGLLRGAGRRPHTVGFLLWAVAQMAYANLRVVAVPVIFAFAAIGVAKRVRGRPDAARRLAAELSG